MEYGEVWHFEMENLYWLLIINIYFCKFYEHSLLKK